MNCRILLCTLLLSSVSAFQAPSRLGEVHRRAFSTTSLRHSENDGNLSWKNALPVLSISFLLSTTTPQTSMAYSDSAGDTVEAVIQQLKTSSGNVEETFKTYESLAAIITEGKGIGGMVNYKGVQLDRGYVADEDTSIYNPGLTLLTESEKERLTSAVVDSRKAGLQANQWSENNEFAFDFLREKLDPYHTYELKGFLGFAPIYAGILYLGVLAVQQFSRDLFTPAYIVGALAFFAPILLIVSIGP